MLSIFRSEKVLRERIIVRTYLYLDIGRYIGAHIPVPIFIYIGYRQTRLRHLYKSTNNTSEFKLYKSIRIVQTFMCNIILPWQGLMFQNWSRIDYKSFIRMCTIDIFNKILLLCKLFKKSLLQYYVVFVIITWATWVVPMYNMQVTYYIINNYIYHLTINLIKFYLV